MPPFSVQGYVDPTLGDILCLNTGGNLDFPQILEQL